MSDNELATKAPESDAQEQSTVEEVKSSVPGDTKVDQGQASMGVSYRGHALERDLTVPRSTA